jgi:serine/threonine-protein kinase
MSPEQAMGRSDVDQRTDVFALGAILYEMLTDKVAFDAPNIAKILLRIMNEQPPPPSVVVPSCPAGLDHVVERGLTKAKEDRYASARELADAVIDAYGLSGSVEEWAERSQAEVEAALAAAKPRSHAPAAEPARVSLPAEGARMSDRGDATLPKVTLPRNDVSSLPAITTGPTLGAMALIALGVVLAACVVVLLLR